MLFIKKTFNFAAEEEEEDYGPAYSFPGFNPNVKVNARPSGGGFRSSLVRGRTSGDFLKWIDIPEEQRSLLHLAMESGRGSLNEGRVSRFDPKNLGLDEEKASKISKLLKYDEIEKKVGKGRFGSLGSGFLAKNFKGRNQYFPDLNWDVGVLIRGGETGFDYPVIVPGFRNSDENQLKILRENLGDEAFEFYRSQYDSERKAKSEEISSKFRDSVKRRYYPLSTHNLKEGKDWTDSSLPNDDETISRLSNHYFKKIYGKDLSSVDPYEFKFDDDKENEGLSDLVGLREYFRDTNPEYRKMIESGGRPIQEIEELDQRLKKYETKLPEALSVVKPKPEEKPVEKSSTVQVNNSFSTNFPMRTNKTNFPKRKFVTNFSKKKKKKSKEELLAEYLEERSLGELGEGYGSSNPYLADVLGIGVAPAVANKIISSEELSKYDKLAENDAIVSQSAKQAGLLALAGGALGGLAGAGVGWHKDRDLNSSLFGAQVGSIALGSLGALTGGFTGAIKGKKIAKARRDNEKKLILKALYGEQS